jgi:hypothetical protein
MVTTNPFAELPSFIPVAAMQGWVVLMVIFVIGGTVLDMIHKGSAKYFFENAKRAKRSAKRTVSAGEKVSMAVQTLASEVLTSAEFAKPRRRISHLFTMYGFIIFVVSSVVLIYSLPTQAGQTPALVPLLWHVGALMLCFGGYWFWFFIRADVSAEGNPWYRLVRADIFIVSLLATATFGLIWSFLQSAGAGGWSTLLFALFAIAATTLFSTVLWSKFAHMFFKPAAAFQKRLVKADESRENLPADYDLTDPEVQAKYPDIPEYMGKNPPNMGLGIKREAPQHY